MSSPVIDDSSSSPSSIPELVFDVAIVGAGFSGTLLAVHLSGAPEPPRVALIERSGRFGPGLAYGASSPEHLLNVPAGKMGAFPGEPDHFLRWLRDHPEVAETFGLAGEVEPGAFLPRPLYGLYLASLADEAASRNAGLERIEAEAVDLVPLPEGGFRVVFADGASVKAGKVVLAWGNFPPSAPLAADSRVLRNPWSDEAREALALPGEVLILGSGLTALDLLATAHRIGRTGRLHVLSRHGRFPQVHRAAPPREAFLKPAHLPRKVRLFFRLVRREIGKAALENLDWRAVVDSLRPFTQDVWRGLPPEERRRFLRHVRPLWEIVRHRAAPGLREIVEGFDRRGLLLRHRGRLVEMVQEPDGVRVTYRPRGSDGLVTLQVAAVINATGPESDLRRIDSALLRNLLERGLVRADPLRLGVEASGPFWRREEPLHTVGSLRKGTLWESTAVPELREQAAELARQLLAEPSPGLHGMRLDGFESLEPGHHWLFEI